jgi:hypothetical protein
MNKTKFFLAALAALMVLTVTLGILLVDHRMSHRVHELDIRRMEKAFSGWEKFE